MTSIFLYFVIGLIVFLGLSEFRRYQMFKDDEALAYPKSRLIRREVVTLLALGLILAVAYKPGGQSPTFDLTWYVACLVGTFVIALLALRDLRETSVDIVAMRTKMHADTDEQLKGLLEEAAEEAEKQKRRRGGDISGSQDPPGANRGVK